MKKIFILVSFMCFIICTSCSKTNSNVDDFSVDAGETNLTVKEEQYEKLTNQLNNFSSKFTVQAYNYYKYDSDFIVSPLSVFMFLSMIGTSTSESSQTQILDALGLTQKEATTLASKLSMNINRNYFSNQLIEKDSVLSKEKVGAFKMSNSLWTDNELALNQNTALKLINSFNSDIFRMDFDNSEDVRQKICNYIKDNTEGVIELKKDDFSVDVENPLIFLNTLYLKDIWGNGKLNYTKESYDFKNENGSLTKTNLLVGQYVNGRAYETENYRHFYTTTQNGYKLKFIVPKNQHTIEDVFTSETIASVNAITDYKIFEKDLNRKYNTRCLFPKFDAAFDGNIIPVLEDLGIKNVFDDNSSNFTALTENKIHLPSVQHVVRMSVDEKGVLGAAVTVSLGFGASQDNYENVYQDFIIDQSFGFIVTDPNDIQIFSGIIKSI